MSCSGSNQEGESSPKEGVVNRYLNSVMTPPKTVCFKEGVMLVEEVKAPKATGTVEARLDELEDKTFRYGTVVYRNLDAHHFMNLELEKKVEEMSVEPTAEKSEEKAAEPAEDAKPTEEEPKTAEADVPAEKEVDGDVSMMTAPEEQS